MPVEYVVINGGKLVIERWAGVITHAEIISHEKKKLQDESIAAGAKALADARSAEFCDTTLDRVHEISDIYSDPGNRTSIATYALVIGGQGFDEAKLWEVQSRRHGVNAIVFNNLEVACIWLGLVPADTQKLIDGIDL